VSLPPEAMVTTRCAWSWVLRERDLRQQQTRPTSSATTARPAQPPTTPMIVPSASMS
jgi:hypothetical protein